MFGEGEPTWSLLLDEKVNNPTLEELACAPHDEVWVGRADGVIVLSASTGAMQRFLPTASPVYGLAAHPDGEHMVLKTEGPPVAGAGGAVDDAPQEGCVEAALGMGGAPRGETRKEGGRGGAGAKDGWDSLRDVEGRGALQGPRESGASDDMMQAEVDDRTRSVELPSSRLLLVEGGMRTPRALWLGLLVLSGSSLAANRSKEFCAAWTKAAAAGKNYQDTLMATLEALGEMGGDWERTLRAVAQSSPGSHVAILRGGAKDLGEKFSCPAFEAPAGAPKAVALLQGEQARGISALGTDGNSLYVLRTARVAGFDKASIWEVKDKAPVRVLVEGLPAASYNAQLVFTPTAVIITLPNELVAVPLAGGEAKRLATGLKQPWAPTLDGDGLVFIDDKALQRVPLAGGEVKRLASLGEYSQRNVIAVSPGGFLVGGFNDGNVLRVTRSGVVTSVMASGAYTVFAAGPELLLHFGSDAAPPKPNPAIKKFADLGGAKPGKPAAPSAPPEGVYRLAFADEAPVRVGPWLEGSYPVVSNGEVFALEGDFPGRLRLVRWKLGAAAPTAVSTPVGETRQLAVDARRVYWKDEWFDALYAQPLKP